MLKYLDNYGMFNFLTFLLFSTFTIGLVCFLFGIAWKKGYIFGSLNFILFEIQFPKIFESTSKNEEKEKLSKMEEFYGSLIKILGKEKKIFSPNPYLVFEIAIPEKEKEVKFYLALPKKFQSIVQKQIQGFFPETEIKMVNNFNIFNKRGAVRGAVLKMKHGQSLSLQTYKKLDESVLNLVINAVESLKEKGEGMAFQLLVKPDNENLFEANIRILVSAENKKEADEILSNIESAFSQFEFPDLNSFYSFRPQGGMLKKLIHNFYFRLFNKKETLWLSAEELTGIFHWPIISIESSKIKYLKFKEAPPPAILPNHGLFLGNNHFRGQETAIRISPLDRHRHLYVAGKAGAGKDLFLKNLIKQDIDSGAGIGVIDSGGDLVEKILNFIPTARQNDIVLFNPADTKNPIGLNILEVETPAEKKFVIKETLAILQKIFFIEHLEPSFKYKMKNALLTLMADEGNPGTLIDLPKILSDPIFARQFLIKVIDSSTRNFWEKELAKMPNQSKLAFNYLVSKMNQSFENKLLKNTLGKNHSGLNFDNIVNNGKIFLADFSKEKMGEMESSLLGLIVVSKLQLAAFRRSAEKNRTNRNFHLYINEFQNFTTDSLTATLSETHNHKIDFILTHQPTARLSEKTYQEIFENIGSFVTFRVGQSETELLAKHFQPIFSAANLMNLDDDHAYAKLLINDATTTPFNINITK